MINLLSLNHCIWRIGLLIHRLKELPTRARVIFYQQPNQKRFLLNGFSWVKYWQMAFNSPNSPKYSPTRILRYMVYLLCARFLHGPMMVLDLLLPFPIQGDSRCKAISMYVHRRQARLCDNHTRIDT